LPHRAIDADIAAILYTSGSTGKPKGVVLSHRNMVAGAVSVASYLAITPADRILSVMPLSFDYGLSQLTCAFHRGATVVLINFLFARDIVRAVVEERITGLGAVPPLWGQLARLEWPATTTLRYVTNTGGAMPGATLAALRAVLPQVQVFLMYGLTEAFRSTYLPPEEIDRRPGSIGRAIPNAEVLVVRPDGTLCDVDEPGELVHRVTGTTAPRRPNASGPCPASIRRCHWSRWPSGRAIPCAATRTAFCTSSAVATT
jgi:acyl-CoA synthetase (AMP-forming)/AMP-acid ligase II